MLTALRDYCKAARQAMGSSRKADMAALGTPFDRTTPSLNPNPNPNPNPNQAGQSRRAASGWRWSSAVRYLVITLGMALEFRGEKKRLL